MQLNLYIYISAIMQSREDTILQSFLSKLTNECAVAFLLPVYDAHVGKLPRLRLELVLQPGDIDGTARVPPALAGGCYIYIDGRFENDGFYFGFSILINFNINSIVEKL